MALMLARRHALVIAIGICLAAVTSAAPARGATLAAASSPAARACGGIPAFNAATAGQIMAGELTISPFPAAMVDPHRDGGVNWSLNPYHDPTWVLDFRQGAWIEQLISGYLAGGPRA